MKKIYLFTLLTVIIACTNNNYDKVETYHAGISQSVITPETAAFMIEPRGELSTGVHDDLYVKAVSLSDNNDTLIIVGFDLIGLDDSLVSSIRKSIINSVGIKAEQIMLTASHTHNSPITLNAMAPLQAENVNSRNKQWEEHMIAATAKTVRAAVDNMHKVSLFQSVFPVQIGANRRLSLSHRAAMTANPNGPALKETDVLFLSKDSAESGVIFSYPAHPVSVHSTSTEFSADYPGYASNYILSHFPESIPLFLQGCAGNINSSLKGGYEAAKSDGNLLGEAVINSKEKRKLVSPAPISFGQREFHLPFIYLDKEITESIAKRIEESIKTAKENNLKLNSGTSFMDFRNWVSRLDFLAENKDAYPGLPFHIQAFAFGKSLAIFAFPSEVFVEYALYIKDHSPFDQTIVLAYTNGCTSYIPSAEAFYLGGYEPKYAQIVYGQPFLSPEIDGIIKKESMILLNELWQKYQ